MTHLLVPMFLLLAIATAQEPIAKSKPADLPKAYSIEATNLVFGAIDKAMMISRGRFETTESVDEAMLRAAMGNAMIGTDVMVEGGWDRQSVWASSDNHHYVKSNGRMVTEVDGEWRLRRSSLAQGQPVPFTLDPDYLFTVLKLLPKKAREVVHVESGSWSGQPTILMTLEIRGDDALELADAGVFPGSLGGIAGVQIFGALGAIQAPPRPELETYIVFHVNAENGDLMRLAAKTFSSNPHMGGVANVQIAIQAFGPPGKVVEEEEEEGEEAEAAEQAEVVEAEAVEVKGQNILVEKARVVAKPNRGNGKAAWKRGFPDIKPERDQSVLMFQADFSSYGKAKMFEIGDKAKALLRLR
jgi:hypothetical protein